MLFDDRWVYFCLTLNWYAAAETDGKTVQAYAAACSRALALAKEALSAWTQSWRSGSLTQFALILDLQET